MSQSVTEFVDGVDGVRGGVAASVGQQYATVADLSEATPEDLTAIKGVGAVLAERILDAARTAVIADHTPEDEPSPDPATRARASVAKARAARRPALEVVEEATDAAASTAAATADDTTTAESPTDQTSLPPVVERVATLVGTTIGWGIRIVRQITQPARHLLHRG